MSNTDNAAQPAQEPEMSEMTDPTEAIKAAIAAGPTDGPWRFNTRGAIGPVSEEDDQSYGMVEEIAWIKAGLEESAANLRFIAACNPAAIRALLDRLDSAERDLGRYQLLRGNYLRVFMADKTGGVAFDLECEDIELGSESDGARLDAAIDAALRVGAVGGEWL